MTFDVDLWNERCRQPGFRGNFEGVCLRNMVLRGADFRGIELLPEQLAGANLTHAKVEIAFPLSTLEATAKHARTLLIVLVLGCAYTWLTIFDINDTEIVLNTGAASLPFIKAEVPILGFFYVTPLILVCVFAYFHLYLVHYWRLWNQMPAVFPDGQAADVKAPWQMVAMVRYALPLLPMRPFDGMRLASVWFLTYALVPFTLLGIGVICLCRHDATLYVWHGGLLVIGVCLAVAFFQGALGILRHRSYDRSWVVLVGIYAAFFIILGWSWLMHTPRRGHFVLADANLENVELTPLQERSLDLQFAVNTFDIEGERVPMVFCSPGEFLMGSPEDEPGRYDNEIQHSVRLTRGFWLGQTEVTEALWRAVMGDGERIWIPANARKPVTMVSWEDTQAFFERVNNLPAHGNFRLPTEAEWEYACRAGTRGAFAGILDNLAFYEVNGLVAKDVGRRSPNSWGLYDMHGNVFEWCQDGYAAFDSGYEDGELAQRGRTNPVGTGEERVLRGGCWFSLCRNVRSAYRFRIRPDFRIRYIGFRLARGL